MGMSADKNASRTTGPEPRTPVMILVEATWQDQSGTAQKCSARMENRSTGGACIRLRRPIHTGAKLHLRWRWEEFNGIARYCRSHGRDYLVGIQKDAEQKVERKNVIAKNVVQASGKGINAQQNGTVKPQPEPVIHTEQRKENRNVDAPTARRLEENDKKEQTAIGATEMPSRRTPPPIEREGGSENTPPTGKMVLRETETIRELKQEGDAARQERKHMRRKWFELGHKVEAQEQQNSSGPVVSKAAPANAGVNATAEARIAERGEDGSERNEVELLSMSDIYQTSGILNPRKGYSILKVAEMLRSEHLRGLSKEMKRATVMVALDAAGITAAEVAEDAKARVAAIDSYEAEQRKQFEAHLARKAEENQHIMAELERIKASYAERLRRNLEGVAREKTTFGNWLTTKQQETQNIAEALELFVNKPEVSATANDSLEAALVSPSAKPV
jgi:hypothetical protein